MLIRNEILCPQHPDNNVYRLVDSIMTDASVLRDFTQPDELSDLTLVIGGTPLHVHKQYLAEWSPVWRQMFLEECSSPQGLQEIAMPDKSLQEVTELLHCIYSTQKPISGA